MSVKVLVVLDVQEPAAPEGIGQAYNVLNPRRGLPTIPGGFKRHYVEIEVPCATIPVTKVVVPEKK